MSDNNSCYFTKLLRFHFCPCHRQTIDGEIKKVVDNAVKAMREDVEIGLEELTTDVMVTPIDTRIRGVHPASWWTHKRLSKPINM